MYIIDQLLVSSFVKTDCINRHAVAVLDLMPQGFAIRSEQDRLEPLDEHCSNCQRHCRIVQIPTNALRKSTQRT